MRLLSQTWIKLVWDKCLASVPATYMAKNKGVFQFVLIRRFEIHVHFWRATGRAQRKQPRDGRLYILVVRWGELLEHICTGIFISEITPSFGIEAFLGERPGKMFAQEIVSMVMKLM